MPKLEGNAAWHIPFLQVCQLNSPIDDVSTTRAIDITNRLWHTVSGILDEDKDHFSVLSITQEMTHR